MGLYPGELQGGVILIEIEISQKDIDSIMKKLESLSIKDRDGALQSSFRAASLRIERRLKENVSGRFLKVRSGRLRSSIGSLVTEEGKGLKASVGSGVRQGNRVPYADILETGGTITPKKGRYLTIPLTSAKTQAGVQRFTAAAVMAGATKYTSSFIAKGIIFGKTGKNGIVPLFVLKTSVSIPAKYWMSRTAKESNKDVVNTILKTIDEKLNK